ncbi:hypothetical protein FACS1894126_5480 [Alphaproteobacteria bacterium]|nr:hypothetical protein FACS1894126_5480 [Alphaproteobacteria bacterium]
MVAIQELRVVRTIWEAIRFSVKLDSRNGTGVGLPSWGQIFPARYG